MTAFRRTLLLLLNHRHHHEWLPSNGGSSNFVTTLGQAGISRVAFLRHGNAPSLEGGGGGTDFDRQLSELGKAQAKSSGETFGRELSPYQVLASNSPRTVDTARIFLDAAGATSTTVRPEPILYDGTMQPGGSDLFLRIGYSSLRTYVYNPDKQDRSLARRLVGGYAGEVINRMLKVALESSPEERNSTLLMVGHALYLPAATLGVATTAGCSQEDQDLILDDQTQEAEGYLVDVVDASVRLLQRPSCRT